MNREEYKNLSEIVLLAQWTSLSIFCALFFDSENSNATYRDYPLRRQLLPKLSLSFESQQRLLLPSIFCTKHPKPTEQKRISEHNVSNRSHGQRCYNAGYGEQSTVRGRLGSKILLEDWQNPCVPFAAARAFDRLCFHVPKVVMQGLPKLKRL